MRRKRLEVRVSCVSFPRAEYHFEWGESWPGDPVCPRGLNERHWTRWRHSRPHFRSPVQPAIPAPSRWPEISRESKDARSSRAILPAMNEFSAYAFSCPTKNIHRAIFPALDERFEKTLDLENIPKHFAKYILVFEWNSLRKKEKKKNISYLHFVWTMHYSKYGSIVILLHRNVRRSCVRNLDRIYLN